MSEFQQEYQRALGEYCEETGRSTQQAEQDIALCAAARKVCATAGKRMVGAMNAQARLEAAKEKERSFDACGMPVTESMRKNVELLSESCAKRVDDYAQKHLAAHRLQFLDECEIRALADQSVLTKVGEVAYRRDVVDSEIARVANQVWLKQHPERVPDKSNLLVGSHLSVNDPNKIFEANTDSPIPIPGTESSRLRAPTGELVYNALSQGKVFEHNRLDRELAPTTPSVRANVRADVAKAESVGNKAPKAKAVEQEQGVYKIFPDARPIRNWPNVDTPVRRRTFIVADRLFVEKKERGTKLSLDPTKSRALDPSRKSKENA